MDNMNDKKMYYKPQYKCGICDTTHDSVAARAKCEATCLKKQEEEAKIAAEAKKKEEQNARKIEVDKAFDNAYELAEKYINDYGTYKYKSGVKCGCHPYPQAKLADYFLF